MKIKLRFKETIDCTLRAIIDKIVDAKRMLDPWILGFLAGILGNSIAEMKASYSL